MYRFLMTMLACGVLLNGPAQDLNGQKVTRAHLEVDSLLNEAFYLKNSDPATGEQLIRKAMILAEDLNYKKGIADAFHVQAMLAYYQGQYVDAMEGYLDALHIREVIRDSVGLGRSFQNLGVIFQLLVDFSEARSNFEKARHIRRLIGDEIGELYSTVSLGEVLEAQGEPDSAEQYYREAYRHANRLGSRSGTAFACNYLGSLYLEREVLDSAAHYFEKSHKLYHEMGDLNGSANLSLKLANVDLFWGDYDLAIDKIKRELPVIGELNAIPLARDAYWILSQCYRTKGDFYEADKALQAYVEVNSQLQAAELSQQMSIMGARFEADQKDRELELLKARAENATLYNSLLIGAIVLIVLIGGFGFILMQNRSQNRVNQLLVKQKNDMEAKNRELAYSNAELADFAHAASHDLKQPVRTISSYAGLLQRRYGDQLEGSGQEFLQYIVHGAASMWQLLNDLLDYARFGHQVGIIEEISAEGLLEEVKWQLKEQIRETKAKILIGPMPRIRGYRSSLFQLFLNLINNAIKFRGAAHPEVVVGYQQTEGGQHRFMVRDNGIGIDPAYQSQIFQAFKRLNQPDEYQGTGLGLAIVMKAVQQHEGRIWLDSEPGAGTTFWIEFPVNIGAQSGTPTPAS